MSGSRDSAGSVAKVCDGFFEDPRYVEEQFRYLTDANISEKIRANRISHLGISPCIILTWYNIMYHFRKPGKVLAVCYYK